MLAWGRRGHGRVAMEGPGGPDKRLRDLSPSLPGERKSSILPILARLSLNRKCPLILHIRTNTHTHTHSLSLSLSLTLPNIDCHDDCTCFEQKKPGQQTLRCQADPRLYTTFNKCPTTTYNSRHPACIRMRKSPFGPSRQEAEREECIWLSDGNLTTLRPKTSSFPQRNDTIATHQNKDRPHIYRQTPTARCLASLIPQR